ncbi:MAG TPA: acetate--CoA ligase family protein [Ramlibacter sp.]|uniref:acetate--CoA ligase family protein n=1 Tax=Ramlibacter sp. TaxID=1917967 RepID=UPI002C89AFCD|nr:acetate--CoA ligase family protein [Ramlibacter sp.]HVZ46514.1 acetate--CoA ligase family protein [Ramlibacter sp.]
MLNPRSVAIIGMSSRPGTFGRQVLENLRVNAFEGPIHLVGRSGGEIDGIEIKTKVEDLPFDIDLAIVLVPAAAVGDALEGCIARGFGGAVVFSSGFAETGPAGAAEQERVGMLASEAGLPVIGPNCTGYTNFISGQVIGFVTVVKVPRLASGTGDAVAIVAQSGGIQGHVFQALVARGVGVSYSIATGNEMDQGLGDFIQYLAEDPSTRVIAVYAEHIRNPKRFIDAARAAKARGKPVVLLHPGWSTKAQTAAQSHTGAMAGDHAVMRAMVSREGVFYVDSLDELVDVTEVLARYPQPELGGLGILTFSGAVCGIAQDFCASLGIDVPELSAGALRVLSEKLEDYITPSNPLDLGTQVLVQRDLVFTGLQVLLAETSIAGVVIAIPAAGPTNAMIYLNHVIDAVCASSKPVCLAMFGDTAPLPPGFVERAREHRIVLSRSADRSMRALGRVIGGRFAASEEDAGLPLEPAAIVPQPAAGPRPEWEGKQILRTIGVPVPPGGLARDAGEAVAMAERIGYPVAMKAQSARLTHKTDAGGVLLDVKDADGVRAGWDSLVRNLANAGVQEALDGMLVEKMAAPGLELLVGAHRDPQWGPVTLVGLGGVLVEAMDDVRVIAAQASVDEVRFELERLKGARLLKGFRHLPPVDMQAVAGTVQKVGRLMLQRPDIAEIDVNPLVAYADGVVALDALFVFS